MNFLSNENYKLLHEIVRETMTDDPDIFNKVFMDFGNLNKNNTEHYDLLTYNKQFLTLLQTIIHNKPDLLTQKRKVTFENKLEEHKQHFLSYSLKPPPTPNFVDTVDNSNLDHIDKLVQQTLLKRNYELDAPSVTRKPRKIQIQSVVEEDTLTNDAILLDMEDSDPIAQLFSKLQNKINDTTTTTANTTTQPVMNPIPSDIHLNNTESDNNNINYHITIIQNNIANILESFDQIKVLINKTQLPI